MYTATSIFDSLCEEYNKNYKTSRENFKEAKEKVILTIEQAIKSARNEKTLSQYTGMLTDAKALLNWSRLLSFIWSEKLAREGLKVLKTS